MTYDGKKPMIGKRKNNRDRVKHDRKNQFSR